MGITYFEKERIFKLDTKNTSYLIGITDEENGKNITETTVTANVNDMIWHGVFAINLFAVLEKNWRIIIWHICSEQKNPLMCLR